MTLYWTFADTSSLGRILPAALLRMGLVVVELVVGHAGGGLPMVAAWTMTRGGMRSIESSWWSCDHRRYHTFFEDEETETQGDKQFSPTPSLLWIQAQGGWTPQLSHTASRTGRRRKHLAPWCETMYRTFIWSYWQTAFRFMSYIPKFPLLVLSNYLPYCVDSQSKRVDTDARKDFPSSIKLNDVSLLGYMKPDKE